MGSITVLGNGELGDGTRCVRAGMPLAAAGEPLNPQPVLTTQYVANGVDFYGGQSNPTWRALESAIGDLDDGDCVLFPSGMAAITALLLTILRAGDVVVLPADGYYLVRKAIRDELGALRLDVREVPTRGPWTPDVLAGARLVLVETPSNPGLDVCDIAAVAALAHAEGALLAVDNTTATPLGQRPLELGADIVLASDTKALAGHSDVVLGHVSTVDSSIAERLRVSRRSIGAAPGPLEVWLAHRGLGTLDLRLRRQESNAAALFDALRGHRNVRRPRWPGAVNDPAYPLARKQMRRFPGVLGFELPDESAVRAFFAASELVTEATSFGGLHSTADRRARWGDRVAPGFLRFSCGVEDSDDLVADVLAACDATND
ncbi:MAG: cystathionine gamma-lyase [Sciscionella sp.]|nr:cystathionine gamma-lyase [Sciscionella sp.]